MDVAKLTFLVKEKAQKLGFQYCGVAEVGYLNDDRKRLEKWLKKGYNGNMLFMERYIDQRANPKLLVDNAKSVIVLSLNYFPDKKIENEEIKISKYAYGIDYHFVIKDKLQILLSFIKEYVGSVYGRGFVDSAPIFEKTWAVRSGMGWIGKNGNLIMKKKGSFFFISSLIVDIPLEYDNEFAYDHCGRCSLCVDSCPTGAIMNDKVIDATKCISYHTIELKKKSEISVDLKDLNNWVFGCDICQDVCPWNKFSKPTSEKQFQEINLAINFKIKDWLNLSKKEFDKLLKNSPIKRARFSGMQQNVKNVMF